MKLVDKIREIAREEARIVNCKKCNKDGLLRVYGNSRSVLDYDLVNCHHCGGRDSEDVKSREQLELLVKQQEQIIRELNPETDYMDIILQDDKPMTTSEVSEHYGGSTQDFDSILEDFGVQYKQDGKWILADKYRGKRYTCPEVKHCESLLKSSNEVQVIWSQKGRLFLYGLLKAEGVLPTMEES